jgi:hypothetical protein
MRSAARDDGRPAPRHRAPARRRNRRVEPSTSVNRNVTVPGGQVSRPPEHRRRLHPYRPRQKAWRRQPTHAPVTHRQHLAHGQSTFSASKGLKEPMTIPVVVSTTYDDWCSVEGAVGSRFRPEGRRFKSG